MEAVRPQITKRRKFIADGVMYSELNEVGLRLPLLCHCWRSVLTTAVVILSLLVPSI